MSIQIQFHGVVCFSIHLEDLIIVFDPHDGKSLHLPPPTIKNADLVLCSHKHYDHNAGKTLVAKKDAKIFEEKEGNYNYKGIEIVGTKVRHGGDPKWGMNIIYTVKTPNNMVFIHGGDMGSIPSQKQTEKILSLGRPDMIFLPIGGKYTINAGQALKTANLLDPKITTVGCHYLYGPLLNKEDFQGMSTEKPFRDLVRENLTHHKGIFNPKEHKSKKFMIFDPPL